MNEIINLKYMLENIKSSFFLQFLFSNIDYRKKLKILKYNKGLQQKIEISSFYYKVFSGRYLVCEKGKGIEYNCYNDKVIFEGEYLNGQRNGKGKEFFDNGELKFEGEYLEGKRIKGREFEKRGYIIYEGEYKNGKRSKGTEYDGNGGLVFEGEYLNGKRWNGEGHNEYLNFSSKIKEGRGIGLEYNVDTETIYQGGYLNGEKNGHAMEFNKGMIVFIGQYKNGKKWNTDGIKDGKGFWKEELNKDNLIIEGEWKNGERNGMQKEYNQSG